MTAKHSLAHYPVRIRQRGSDFDVALEAGPTNTHLGIYSVVPTSFTRFAIVTLFLVPCQQVFFGQEVYAGSTC